MGRLRMKWILMLGIIFSVVLSNAQEEEELVQELFEEEGEESKPNITLTGIPQIDYIHDPNLPRELNGYDLSTYPFLNKMPKNITFKCDGRHDGFYANIEWNCQVYHQCLFGIRYDFMCANFTSFDQKNFNCIFASDVDCPNSERFFDRNDALYKTTTTTTETPPFLGILRNQRPRRPHPQLARLRNSENPRFEEYEDYDLPVIPKQRVEESKFQNAVNSDQEPIQDISSQKLSQELGENGIVASFPVRAGTGQGRLRAIAQRRRRPGRPNRRRPFRPVYYDDYYDYYDDEYALTDKNDYDYDYSNNRFSIRRPGKKRPSQAKVNQGSQDQEETGISDQEKELSARPKNVENNSADAVEAQESKTQLSPTPEERRRLFQQRGSLKQRGPIEPPMLKTTTMITAQTSTTTTMKPSTSEQDVEYYYDIEYVDEDPDQPFEEAVITTTKSDTVPKLQPAFRRAGLPERQVRTEEPLTTEPTSSVSRSVEEPVGATKLRNRLNFLRSRDRETVRHSARAQTSSIPSSSTESQITVEAVTEPEPKRKSGRRSQRPSIVAIVETEDPQAQMIEITTFRNQRSRRINRNREIKS